MPCDYHRDDDRSVVWIRTTEPIVVLDVTRMLDRQLAEGIWHFEALVDARRAILSRSDGNELLEHVRRLATQYGPPGPVALVTRQGLGPAQIFAIHSEQAGLGFEVFWDVDEAERWLTTKTGPG